MEINSLYYNNTVTVLAWLLVAMLILLGLAWYSRNRDRQIDTLRISMPLTLFCVGTPAITAYMIWMPIGRFDVLFFLKLSGVVVGIYIVVFLLFQWVNWTFQFSRQYLMPLQKWLNGYAIFCLALFLLDIVMLNFK